MTKNFDPYAHFGFLTHRVARLIDIQMTAKLKSKGYHFPTSCIGILGDLWQKDGITQKELGISIIKTKSSINKMLQSLEEAGLILKKDDPSDKRSKLIFLTDQGKHFRSFVEANAPIHEAQFVQNHSPEDIAITKRVLKTFYLNLKEKITKEESQ